MTPGLIDALLEGAEVLDSRRRQGSYFTPPALAAALADATIVGATGTVLDPACGGGALLLAALERRRALGAAAQTALAGLMGFDIDPAAVEVARLRLHARADMLGPAVAAPLDDPSWRHVDTLALPAESVAVDVVLANPPFGNAIRDDTGRDADEKARFQRDYPEASTGAYDRAGLFVEWSVRASREAVGLIVPRALLPVVVSALAQASVWPRAPGLASL